LKVLDIVICEVSLEELFELLHPGPAQGNSQPVPDEVRGARPLLGQVPVLRVYRTERVDTSVTPAAIGSPDETGSQMTGTFFAK